ncbi:hypothetical protein [Streptomyces sp. NPDC058653]|uniref:hypothetical protein n=1 Tax=Streptomyces sp. NPDC058653 TaxID=3346576 RepID=UPI00364814E7
MRRATIDRGDSMLARQYGYPISAGAARDTPGVLGRVDELCAPRPKDWIGFGCVVLLASGFTVTAFLVSLIAAKAVAGLGALLFWLAAGSALHGALTGQPFRKPAREALARPWQLWPCRLVDRQEAFSGGRQYLELLAPDRSVAASFHTKVPEEVVYAMTDGVGVLLIAGDLRYFCVAAMPDGRSLFLLGKRKHQAQPQPAPPRASSDPLLDGVIGQARSAIIGDLLG